MDWLALRLQVDQAEADGLSDALLEGGAGSVWIEDADRDSGAEQPRFDEPGTEPPPSAWRRNVLVALLPGGTDPERIVGAAARVAGLDRAPAYTLERIGDDDWVRRSQSQFPPVMVNQQLCIAPTWSEPVLAPGCTLVRLDPGQAFGTGTHATTRLVLDWITRHVRGGERVLDYGCGSGILAIVAAKFGAREVDAVDIDPRALEACAANATLNNVTLRVCDPHRVTAGGYDMVVANILANPLVVLAPLLAELAARGARIALSGILESQTGLIADAYENWFDIRTAACEGGWALVEGVRR